MAKTIAKAKETAPAATPGERALTPHELVLSPVVQGAAGIEAWSKFAGQANLGDLVKGVRDRIKQVQDGDMAPIEAMLLSQAMTLETIFTSLARRAANQEYLKQFQTHLVLALKAQAQSRATLEALAEIKNPRPVAFVKQANISGGHQQVNNGAQALQAEGAMQTSVPAAGDRLESSPSINRDFSPVRACAPARQTTSLRNELLEDDSKPNEPSALKEVHPAEMR